MEKILTFNIFTNCCILSPNTDIIQYLITSIENIFSISLKKFIINIFIDPNPHKDRYDSYLENIKKQFINYNINLYKTEGLSDSYKKSINICTTPLLFQLEHDWILLPTIKHSLEKICNILLKNEDIHTIRFNKRDNIKCGMDKYMIEYIFDDLPLCKTPSVSNNPHIAHLNRIKKRALYIRDDKGSHGIEDELRRKKYKQFHQNNFVYGVYNYPPTIKHTDGRGKDKKINKNFNSL